MCFRTMLDNCNCKLFASIDCARGLNFLCYDGIWRLICYACIDKFQLHSSSLSLWGMQLELTITSLKSIVHCFVFSEFIRFKIQNPYCHDKKTLHLSSRPVTSRKQQRQLPQCPIVIALVPLKFASRNLQFPHTSHADYHENTLNFDTCSLGRNSFQYKQRVVITYH